MLFLITKLHGKIKTDNGFGTKYEVQKFARAASIPPEGGIEAPPNRSLTLS